MVNESHTAVVARNVGWTGPDATEPYEAGWAREAVIFVRALEADGPAGTARVQLSPDGMRWVDEGTSFPLPSRREGVTFARVREFGTWLRIAVDLPPGTALTVMVTISLKA